MGLKKELYGPQNKSSNNNKYSLNIRVFLLRMGFKFVSICSKCCTRKTTSRPVSRENSPAINVKTDTSSWAIDAKPIWARFYQLLMSTRSQAHLPMSKRTQALKRSMPNQRAQSRMIQQGPNYSITVIKVEYLATNLYF